MELLKTIAPVLGLDDMLGAIREIREGQQNIFNHFGGIHLIQIEMLDRFIFSTWQLQIKDAKNPLNQAGRKIFSQTDEDGITLEILKRIGLQNKGGTFAEFGAGNGCENNTLALIANRWKGFWVGGETLFFKIDPSYKNFHYEQKWIDLNNIVDLTEVGMRKIGCSKLDVVSLDLDGNDIYFVEKLLNSGILPALFIVEHNAKFPPPIEFQIEYNDKHRWTGDDYFGASLMSFVKLFTQFSYTLVCCNAHSGANAFFVKDEFLDKFTDVSREIGDLYYGPQYQLYRKFGHPPSPKTIEIFLAQNEK